MSHGIHTTTRTRLLAPLGRLGRLGAIVAASLLAAAAVLVTAAPAAAHDELLGTDPAADATVDALPAAITFTYSAVIAADAGASVVEVTDAAGVSLVDGEPTTQDNTLTQPLAGDASGEITVLWKVVSSDGHPISGELAFTVTTPVPTPTESSEPSPTAEPEPSAEPTVTATAAPVPDDQDSSFADVWPWIVFGLGAAGLGGAVLYLLVSRARRTRELEESRARALGGGQDSPAAESDTSSDR